MRILTKILDTKLLITEEKPKSNKVGINLELRTEINNFHSKYVYI